MKVSMKLLIASMLLAAVGLPVSNTAFAAPTETGDKCFDGRDNDRDGLIDGDDPDCAGAPPPGPSLEEQVAELQGQVAELQGLVATLQSGLQANTAADSAAHHAAYTDANAITAVGPHSPDLTNEVGNNTASISANVNDISGNSEKLQFITIDYGQLDYLVGPHFIITGANVHVRNGGSQTSSSNGLGNLIVGYNELNTNTQSPIYDHRYERGGSHNLVVGAAHAYSSFGGFIAGGGNALLNQYASITGGGSNAVDGPFAVISGGNANTATGYVSWVGGGESNTSIGEKASISGGRSNQSLGYTSSVTGGVGNTAGGENYYTQGETVNGGSNNLAIGFGTTVSGGSSNTANTDRCWIGDAGYSTCP